MKRLANFPDRLLLAVVGLTPQVVTETLFALIVGQQYPFIPTRLKLITTGNAYSRLHAQLLDDKNGKLYAFARDYAPELLPRISDTEIVVLRDAQERELPDIASADDSTAAADQIIEIVREATRAHDRAICASIAGGRKSMGFLLGYAMSLFGRPQDRLSHVLVNKPFQDQPAFFYPPPQSQLILASPDASPVSTDEARITLTDIPFLRLRETLPDWLLTRHSGFAETIADAQGELAPVRLTLCVAQSELRCAGESLRLSPVEFAFAWWLAEKWLEERPAHMGISWRDARPADFLIYYAKVAKEGHRQRVAQALGTAMEQQWFEQRVSRLNKLVKRHLGVFSRYCRITSHGKRPFTRYGFSPALAEIRIEEGHPGGTQ